MAKQNKKDEQEKKRYYNPREVLKEKGCVGCGSMALGVVGLGIIVLPAIVLF